MNAHALEQLRERSQSPFSPEPPRRSLVVNAVMRLAHRPGARALETPHLHGGSDEDKVLYEYESAEVFWEAFGGDPGTDILAGRDVIDVGCGWGGKAIRYAEETGLREIHGFDLPGVFDPQAPARFAAARGVENAHFTTGYAEEIPYDDERFDVTIMDDVLEHVADPPATIAECARVLRPGGTLVVKFPSVRMLRAHHLDRALTWPGLHYLLPLRRWAGGLNAWLLDHPKGPRFEPFDEVVSTPYHRSVTRNLNGLGLSAFRLIVEDSKLEVQRFELEEMALSRETAKGRAARAVYGVITRVPRVHEALANAILFVGVKPPAAPPGLEPDASAR